MAKYDIDSASRTDFSASSNFSVAAQTLDAPDFSGEETFWDFPDASKYLGYYKTIPELKKAIDALALWTVGKGTTTDIQTANLVQVWGGSGQDSFQEIMKNLIRQKKAFGDAFAEIVRAENGVIINLKPLYTGDMRVVFNKEGIIIRYEQRNRDNKNNNVVFKTSDIFHLSNDRIGNELHGVSVIEACQWVIDARNEALTDHRVVLHRNRIPVRIIEVDTDDTTKIATLISTYEKTIKQNKGGQVFVIPKGTVEFKDNTIAIQDPITWIQYLENFFYVAVGVPRPIVSIVGTTEASSKVGFLTFEPVYTSEQTELESDILSQLGLTLKFNRPPSLSGVVAQDEQKNAGQTGIQPNDSQVSATRTE